MKKILLTTLVLSCLVIITSAQIIHVPADQPTIQAGINAATTGDIVLVAEGIYYENIRFMGKAITVTSEFINDGDTSHIFNTIIDGSQATDADSAATVMFINMEDTNSIINGFTITGGSGVLSTFYNIRKGGGIFCNDAGGQILNNRIIENLVEHENKAGGGGIGCQRETFEPWVIIKNNYIAYNICTTPGISAYAAGIHANINTIIENNVLEYNQCENTGSGMADGGAIEIEEYPGYSINTAIVNNIIRYNSIAGYDCYGGGINIIRAKANIIDNIVKNNTVTASHNGNGGGIWFDSPLQSAKLINNDISDNTITGGNYGRGGGVGFWNPRDKITMINNSVNNNETAANEIRGAGAIFRCNQYPTGIIEVVGNEFINNLGNTNAANFHGGGICLNDAGDTLVIIDKNRIEGNNAILGGGIFSRRSYNLQLTNNLLINNISESAGGALRMYQNTTATISSLHPKIINNTFYGNSSNVGGAISLYCETNVPLIFNNIFRENEAPGFNDIHYDISGNDSIFVSHNNINLTEVYGIWTGSDNINVDPSFVDPEAGEFHINENSLCAGAGIEIVEVMGTTCCCPAFDFDNEPRPFPITLNPDMGADEVDEELGTEVPKIKSPDSNFQLSNYPNPFSNSTNIEFNIPENGNVKLFLLNTSGIEVQMLANEFLSGGKHQLNWNASGLPAGIYFLRLEVNGICETRKLLLLK